MQASASNLVEELGMVEYVFSDKTGTLTCNIMEFRKFTAGHLSYGLTERATEGQLSNVNFNDPKLQRVLSGQEGTNDDKVAAEKVLRSLALCHDIVIDTASGKYNAASPDELALVNFAKQIGFNFIGYDDNERMQIKLDEQDIEKY